MTWAFHFNGLFMSKVYIVWVKKVERNNLSWSWKGIQNLERNRLIVSKLASGIWQILTRALKDFNFNGLLMSKKCIFFVVRKYRGVIFHETEEGYKTWGGIDWSFQNWDKKFDNFWLEHFKVSKVSPLMGSFSAKYILLEVKNYGGVIFHETEGGY